MAVEEAAAREVEDLVRDILEQVVEPLLELLGRLVGRDHLLEVNLAKETLALLGQDHVEQRVPGGRPGDARALARDRGLEDDDERVERVVVERVHLVQLGEHEEHERATAGDLAVRLAADVDPLLRLDGDRHLLGNLGGDALRVLEVLDELDVLGHVARRLSELLQDAVLELLHLDLVLVVGRDDLRLLLFQIRPLLGDSQCEQLVLEAVLSHHEVDQRRLRLHLGRVVRVGQLRLQVHFEGRLVVHLLVAELDERGAPTTHHLPTDDRREHSIIREAEVLDDEGLAA